MSKPAARAGMRFYAGVERAVTPPIADVQGWVDGLHIAGNRPLLDVAQAVPVEPPDAALLRHVGDLVAHDGLHRYTPIRGLPALREALATHMAGAYDAALTAAHVTITAGCNQAYCAVLRALAGPGDEVVLPLPYYFNHQMWLDMLGAASIYVPFEASRAGVPDLDAVAARISPRTRALVLVTPNNPTGAVYPHAFLEAAYDLAAGAGIALVLDETYKDFHPAPGPPHRLFERPDWESVLVQLYSFSKAYSLTGYRVGAVVAGPRLNEQITKIQDCVSICTPRVSQEAALYALTELHAFAAGRAKVMSERLAALRDAFAASEGDFRLVCSGAWFAYVQHPFEGVPGTRVAQVLAREHGVLCVPGQMFGPGQEAYLRFAVSNLGPAEMPGLVERLAEMTDVGGL